MRPEQVPKCSSQETTPKWKDIFSENKKGSS